MSTETTDTQGEYSPLLAQMMRMDPDRISKVTLSGLGRQAVGADSPEYQKLKGEVDAARQAMSESLSARRTGPDPEFTALAAGFLAPTKTGSFGESLSQGLQGYSKAALEEEARQRETSKMKFDLARSGLLDEQEMAKMGLSVVSKLTPKMTAYQLQVQSEGIDPRTPAGVTRIKELMAVDKATPEMKDFAARSGISLMDPRFTEMYAPFNADVQKKLAQFGGSFNNPADVKRAQKMVAEDADLEQKSKKTSIEHMQTQTKRTKQEIDEHTRTDNTDAIVAKARELGVPIASTDRYAGLNPVEKVAARNKDYEDAQKVIEKEVNPLINNIDTEISDLERARLLNKQLATGPTLGVPVVGGLRKYTSGDMAKYQEFDAISARAAAQNRIPGDHNISNFDLQNMAKGTFSSDKEPITNEKIISYKLEQKKRDRDYAEFQSSYAAVNGKLGADALAAWRKYVNANPIMTRNEAGQLDLNPNKITYQQYFSMPRVRVDASGREVSQ
jgi:hypothetical protein